MRYLDFDDICLGFFAAVFELTLLAFVVFGSYMAYTSLFTGPCTGRGGVSAYAQDYIYCNNGSRVDLKPSNGNTLTVRVRN